MNGAGVEDPTTPGVVRPLATGPDVVRDWPREFEQEVLVHRERLYRRALSLCRNPVDAEDLVQETYLRAFRFFDQFTPGTNCRAWLLTILRHTFIGRVTRGAREVVGPDDDTVERALDRCAGLSATPEEEFFHHVITDRHLATAMDGLSPSFREAVILADIDERSYREIAQMCELPIGTVMSRLARARGLLRKALRDRRGVRGDPGNASSARSPGPDRGPAREREWGLRSWHGEGQATAWRPAGRRGDHPGRPGGRCADDWDVAGTGSEEAAEAFSVAAGKSRLRRARLTRRRELAPALLRTGWKARTDVAITAGVGR